MSLKEGVPLFDHPEGVSLARTFTKTDPTIKKFTQARVCTVL